MGMVNMQLLNLALTKKSKQTNEFETMCGFPLGSVDSYVEKLVGRRCFYVWACQRARSHRVIGLETCRSCIMALKSPSATRLRCVTSRAPFHELRLAGSITLWLV